MKKVVIALGVIILVIVVGVVIFAATFDVNRYRGTIQSELQKRLGRQVTLGEMNLKLFPPRFRVQNVMISEDPNFKDGQDFYSKESDNFFVGNSFPTCGINFSAQEIMGQTKADK